MQHGGAGTLLSHGLMQRATFAEVEEELAKMWKHSGGKFCGVGGLVGVGECVLENVCWRNVLWGVGGYCVYSCASSSTIIAAYTPLHTHTPPYTHLSIHTLLHTPIPTTQMQ